MRAFSSNKPEGGVKWQMFWWLGWSLLVLLGIGLGGWQWQRADEKQQYLDELAAAPVLEAPTETPPEGARVTLRGRFVAEQTRFLDNRVHQRQQGVAVLTPLVDQQGRWWVIERGFVATGPHRNDPTIETPTGQVEVQGQWQSAGREKPLFGPNQEGRRLQYIDLSVWKSDGRDIKNGWLHQQGGDGAYTVWWAPNVMPPSRHLGYAFQWWGLALAAAVVMWLGARSGRHCLPLEEKR